MEEIVLFENLANHVHHHEMVQSTADFLKIKAVISRTSELFMADAVAVVHF